MQATNTNQQNKEHTMSQYNVKITIGTDSEILHNVKASDEWKARSVAMAFTKLKASGQMVAFEVEKA